MIRPAAPSFRRRLAIGAVVLGISAVAPISTTLEAGAAHGAGLGAVNVHAVAVGLRMPLYSHQGEDGELEVPYAVSDLGGGGIAHALTSLLWPGATGASLGSTVQVLNSQIPIPIPSQVTDHLNDPFKAEAPTTTGQTSASKSQPGFTMQALALPTHVNASSALGLSQLSSLKNNAGPIVTATTNIAFNGASTVVADAETAATDIGIGPLQIGSILSTAHATSNGKQATGTTETQIVGATIAGVGVTINQDGIGIANQHALPASVVKTLTDTVNTALKAAGISIYLTKPSMLAHGPQISLIGSDLIVMLNKPGYKSGFNDTGIFAEFGGASISANAVGGYVAPVLPTAAPSSAPSTSSNSVPPVQQPPPPNSTGAVPGPMPSVAAPVLATSALTLPGALSSWWVIAGLLLALLTGAALWLLPGRALAAAGAGCRLEEES
ncbi:MAG: hypothetical protein ACTHK4_12340 [Mycobacteriales bacterium]